MDFESLERSQLEELCIKNNITPIGKTTQLVSKLKELQEFSKIPFSPYKTPQPPKSIKPRNSELVHKANLEVLTDIPVLKTPYV